MDKGIVRVAVSPEARKFANIASAMLDMPLKAYLDWVLIEQSKKLIEKGAKNGE